MPVWEVPFESHRADGGCHSRWVGEGRWESGYSLTSKNSWHPTSQIVGSERPLVHVFPSGDLANNDASLALSEAQGQMGTTPFQVCARMKLWNHLLRGKVEERAAHLQGSLRDSREFGWWWGQIWMWQKEQNPSGLISVQYIPQIKMKSRAWLTHERNQWTKST